MTKRTKYHLNLSSTARSSIHARKYHVFKCPCKHFPDGLLTARYPRASSRSTARSALTSISSRAILRACSHMGISAAPSVTWTQHHAPTLSQQVPACCEVVGDSCSNDTMEITVKTLHHMDMWKQCTTRTCLAARMASLGSLSRSASLPFRSSPDSVLLACAEQCIPGRLRNLMVIHPYHLQQWLSFPP